MTGAPQIITKVSSGRSTVDMAQFNRFAMAPEIRIPIDRKKLSDFCTRWKIKEFSLFGSVLRKDFGPKSDVDVLVTFSPEARWSFFDLAKIKKELEGVVGRDVDLVTRKAVEASRNPIRRRAILSSSVTLHAA